MFFTCFMSIKGLGLDFIFNTLKTLKCEQAKWGCSETIRQIREYSNFNQTNCSEIFNFLRHTYWNIPLKDQRIFIKDIQFIQNYTSIRVDWWEIHLNFEEFSQINQWPRNSEANQNSSQCTSCVHSHEDIHPTRIKLHPLECQISPSHHWYPSHFTHFKC
jgi:hypothetical protein